MLDCINKEDKLIDYAISLGMSGIAITDHESVSSYVKALKYMESLKKKAADVLKNSTNEEDIEWAKRVQNFKLALGNEIYLCRDGLNKSNYVKGQDYYYHFILIAKDKIGNDQIRQLSSRAWSRSFRQFIERVPTYYADLEEIILPNQGHVIASTACLGGQFAKTLNNGDFIHAENFARWCEEVFGKGNFFLEYQPGEDPDQIRFNKLLYEFCKTHDYKTIITTDAHYLAAKDRPIHKAFLNSGDGDRETDKFYATTYVMDADEIRGRLQYLPRDFVEQSLENTNLIRDQIQEYNLNHKQIIPRVPMDWSLVNRAMAMPDDKYKHIWNYLNSEYEEDRYFIGRVLTQLYKENLNDNVHWARLEEECETFWAVSDKIKERISAYFITLSKVIDLIWTKGDSLVGPWRGSAGSSLCAYLIGIIQRDPLKSPIELPIWRFMSVGRAELPDIDVDSQASRREKSIAEIEKYFESIGGELTAVATFGTETSKAALQTAARGLGYEPEVGTYLSSLVPIDRGFVRSLSQCYNGDEEKDYKPIPQFIVEMKNYPDIWEVAQGIEGLISRRGVHASGIILTNHPVVELGATMRSPKGVKCTQYELHDSESMGLIKFDMLTIDGLDRIRATMDLLIEYGYIDWQGTLKDTYMKYLSPDIINYDDKDMWRLVGENKIVSLFQFDTPQGLQTAKLIKPESLLELAQSNSLMRLMPDGDKKETPAEEFAKYKKFPYLIKTEIDALAATKEEKEILLEFMTRYGGVLDSQESAMQAVMLPFTNYNVDESNRVRKTIAKKQMKNIAKERQAYFDRGHELGTSEDILKYIWDVQIARQLGYSFSSIHTTAYSIVAIQELNLAHFYPPIFWNTACLIVDSGGMEEKDEDEDIPEELKEEDDTIEETVEEEDEEGKDSKTKKQSKTVNYGKISSAINKMKQYGINVAPPDINESTFTFKPNLEENKIVYGLKGITRISADYVRTIMSNRPYTSLDDFLSKVKSTKLQVINLIKSGAFDMISCGDTREKLLEKYIMSVSNCKKRLTLQNMPGLIQYGVIPEEFNDVASVFNFNKFLKKNCKDGDYYILDEYSLEFYSKYFDVDQLSYESEKTCIRQKIWDKMYKSYMEKIRPFLQNPEVLEELNRKIIQEVWDKYCDGNISKWEMDSIGFYNGAHELDGLDFSGHDIINFFNLPEEPLIERSFETKDGKTINMFRLFEIAGTVIEKNKLKNIVTLLTQDGVVKVKIYKPQFVKYDKQAFIKDEETGKKKITEKSWFTRGNKLIISGFRRGDFFIPKYYKTSPRRPISLIENINYNNGTFTVKSEREE